MKTTALAIVICSWITTIYAQPSNCFLLWPKVPGALGVETKDSPTITSYLPSPRIATGAAIVICPGGAYQRLAPHEGEGYAHWLNEYGVAAFVLKYRLGSDGYRHPAMLLDAARAVRLVRANAQVWHLDPKRVGIIGSSAGGHLASTLLTHFDSGKPDDLDPVERMSSRPDLGILCYAVITMGEFTHQGSKNNLLGTNPPPKLIKELSNELHVTKDTPSCFIWHNSDDKVVPIENSLQFAVALHKAGVPFELHIYQKGGHGVGLGSLKYDPSRWLPWTHDCIEWLKIQSFVK